PGVQKVVQAAGRVIRTQQDQGVVMLIDDRFGDSKVKQLLPRWWTIAPATYVARQPPEQAVIEATAQGCAQPALF
ncbi:helicase C-terminal domain-containing protein, partial [Pseudomonas neuropathica]